jgi:autotransporter-associated beta strand protein
MRYSLYSNEWYQAFADAAISSAGVRKTERTMKMKNMLGGAVAVAVAFVTGGAGAADYNQNSADTLTGDVSYDNVRIGLNGGSGTTIVNASGTTSFTAGSLATPASQFYVGVATSTTSAGTLQLGALNTIYASQVTIGGLQATSGDPDPNGADGHAGRVTTAASSVTTINAANMAVGSGKGRGTQFGSTDRTRGGVFTLGSGATLNLYGITGSGSRANLIVGRLYGEASRVYGTMDLSAGTANLNLSSLILSRTTKSQGVGDRISNTAMTLGTSASNHLNVSGAGNVVQVGYNLATGSTVPTTAVLTIGNLDATSSVTSTDNQTAILIGYKGTGAGATSGTLNLNGGPLKITTTGAAIAGGGGETSALNLASSSAVKLIAGANSADWIHSLSAAVINANGLTIDTDGKEIGVSQAFSGAGGLTKDGAGTLELKGANTYSGATQINAGALVLSGDVAALAGGDVTVGASGTFGGKGTVGGNVTFAAGAKLAFDPVVGTGFTVASGKTVSFGGFSIANLIGTDGFALDWDGMDLDLPPYTLIGGLGTIDWTNVSNVGLANAADVGTGRKAYFQEGSLQLVVIPEPATFGIVLSVLAAAVIRRKRFG